MDDIQLLVYVNKQSIFLNLERLVPACIKSSLQESVARTPVFLRTSTDIVISSLFPDLYGIICGSCTSQITQFLECPNETGQGWGVNLHAAEPEFDPVEGKGNRIDKYCHCLQSWNNIHLVH